MPPKDLVKYGYLTDAQIKAFRQAKIRCWYDRDNISYIESPTFEDQTYRRVRRRLVWTEPIIVRIAELYQKNSHKFAGFTETEFVIRMSPDKS